MRTHRGISRPAIAGAAFALLLIAARGHAQVASPLQPANTSSPRDTLHSFRAAGREIYAIIRERGGERTKTRDRAQATHAVDRFVGCLDLSQQPAYLRESIGREAAVCLLEVLDRIDLPPEAQIPGEEQVEAGEEELQRWRIPKTEITIHRVSEGPRQGEYLFSPRTVANAAEYYERVKHLPYKPGASEGFYQWLLSEPGTPAVAWLVHRLPDWMRQRVYGQAWWQWFGLALTLLAGLAIMIAAYWYGRWRTRQLRNAGGLRRLVTLWVPIAVLVVPSAVSTIVDDYLVVSGMTLAVVKFACSIVFLIAVLVLIVTLGNRVADLIIASPSIHPQGIDAQFIRIVSRVLSLVVAIIVFLEGGKYLGIPLTTLLAGAGVGGLTIALAAQDTLRNLFGSMMILLDKPFRVGERVIAKGYDGVVQEIGLRSTKLRLLTGHEATIPNEEMARTDIENVGRRLHIRRVASLALPLDLPPEKCEQAVTIVREILADHEGMEADYPPRVFLNEFNRDSLNLRFFYWYHPPNYWDFLAFSERVNLEIKRRFAAAEIPFALPTSKTIWEQDEERRLELSPAAAQEAEDNVN